MQQLAWEQIQNIGTKNYVCGYCCTPIASEKGWKGHSKNDGNSKNYIYVCHNCTRPTFFDIDGDQVPGAAFGSSVKGIPDDSTNKLYEEARKATSAGSYTAAVLCCRKLLMHIAVSKGAKDKQTFAFYVKYLSDQHYVPPDATGWVDHIREKGNEANHEIVIMKREDAEELLSFIEMLLKVIFEFPSVIKNKLVGASTSPTS